MRRAKIAERQRFADDLARRDAMRGTAPLKPRKPAFHGHKRLRLSLSGEARTLVRLLDQLNPERVRVVSERSITMAEIANIEIVEPFVRLGVSGDEGSINLDQETAQALYALAWERFEKALVNANAIYNEEPTEQLYQHNRVKRLLWEATDLKQAIEVIYYMTALPEEDVAEYASSAACDHGR